MGSSEHNRGNTSLLIGGIALNFLFFVNTTKLVISQINERALGNGYC